MKTAKNQLIFDNGCNTTWANHRPIHTYITLHYITIHTYITYITYNTFITYITYITYNTYIHTHIQYNTIQYNTIHYIHTLPTYIHTCIHAYMHTCIHAYMHTCMHDAWWFDQQIYTYIHTCIHAYITYILTLHTLHTIYSLHTLHTLHTIHTYTHTIQYNTLQYNTMQYTTIQYNAMQNNTIHYIHTLPTYIHTYMHTYIHTLHLYIYILIWIQYMLDIIYSMVYSDIHIYVYIYYIHMLDWINMNSSKKGCVFLTKKRCNARWLGIYSNQHDHDFFSKHILGICGTSVKGSHPLEFIQHKKRQAWSFLFRCGMYSNQKRPYKDPIQHREDGHNIPFPRDEGSDSLLEVKCRPLPATRSGMAKNVPRKNA